MKHIDSQLIDATVSTSKAPLMSLPNSTKIMVQGSCADVQVPMRRIQLTETPLEQGGSQFNEDFYVYDTSGPYTDANVTIDYRQGIDPIRSTWIKTRQDTEQLQQFSSAYTRQQQADNKLQKLTFPNIPLPLKGAVGQTRHANALRSPRYYYT